MFVNFYRNDLKLAFSALVFSKKKKKVPQPKFKFLAQFAQLLIPSLKYQQ